MDLFIHIASAATEAATHAAEVAGAAADTHAAAQSTGVAQLFGLNVKLFLAQLINFLVILFILWRFVFKPISKALEDRSQKIEASLAEAQRISADRETFDSWKDKEISSVRQEAAAIITKAKGEAEQVRSEIAETTKQESMKIVEKGKQQLEDEKNRTISEIKTEIAEMVVSVTETILKKKLDSSADKAMIKEAIDKLNK